MSSTERLHALDAVRGFALLLGVVFHAGFSFLPGLPPGIWAIVDNSPSTAVGTLLFTSHIFRMSLFFFVAGFFAHLMFERKGARGFWLDRAKRILVPLIAGWPILIVLLGAVWVWGLTKTFGGTLPAPPPGAPPPPPGAFPLTHLWFLYYLLILYALLLLARLLIGAVDRKGTIHRGLDRVLSGIVRTGSAALVLPLPLAASLYMRSDWVMWFGIPTPDQSVVPQAASLVGYGTAVGFGWLVYRQIDLLAVWRGQWTAHLAMAVGTTGICLSIAGAAPALTPAAPGVERLAYAIFYGIAIWSWVFAIIGAAVRFMSHGIPAVRYVADSSYWIYLVHLPIVAALQVLVGHRPWHWTVKLPLILAASLAVLFASYHYLVRPTFVGQLLNGRKYPRRAAAPAPIGPAAGTECGDRHSEDRVALLRGARKTYGATIALAGLDLDVRHGELLAVLGPNGAGKSTAIALWLGLLEPDAGAAELFGRSPLDVDARRGVGVMMQDVSPTPDMRIRELIALTAGYYPGPLSVAETLALTRTEPLADRVYAKLSGGEKRLVQFALAICGRPRLVFLDEPTVSLDVEARETIWRTVRAMVADGCSVVLTTHYLEEAEALADRVAVLASGRLIAAGTVADIRSLVARKLIFCTTTLTPTEVGAWSGVVAAQSDGRRLQVTVVDAEEVVRRLLAADPRVRDLEVRQAGLAEAFAELTREAA